MFWYKCSCMWLLPILSLSSSSTQQKHHRIKLMCSSINMAVTSTLIFVMSVLTSSECSAAVPPTSVSLLC